MTKLKLNLTKVICIIQLSHYELINEIKILSVFERSHINNDRKNKSSLLQPWQYTYYAGEINEKCLISLGFSRVRGKFKVGFRPSLDHLKCVENKTKIYSDGELCRYLFNIENYILEIVYEEKWFRMLFWG